MMKKPWKIVKSEHCTSECKIYGNNHWIELDYEVPEWNEDMAEPDVEEYFMYKGIPYFTGEFMPITKESPFFIADDDFGQVFDGYHSDSFFSGILIKYHEYGDAVKAYTYIS